MKRLILALTLLGAMTATSQAQDNHVFAGVRYDDGATISVGLDIQLFNSIHELTYTNVGTYGSIATEFAVITPLGGGLYGGVLAGPNVDFGNGETESTLTYLTGASGALLGYEQGKVGAVAYAKYKFAVVETITYQDGYEFGAMGTYSF